MSFSETVYKEAELIMITKKFINDFIKKFEHCKNVDSEWNTNLFKRSGSESWANMLIERSRDMRRIFEINEEGIRSLETALNASLSDKEYRIVAEAALRLYRDGYDDIRVFTMMLEPCIAYFLSIKDLDLVIPLIHAYCFEYEQAEIESIEKPKYSYEDVFEFKDDYFSLSTRYARLTIFKSYSNVISRELNRDEAGAFSKMYSLYLEALAIWNDERAQALDGEDEEFVYFIERMRLTVTLYENVSALTDEEKTIFERLIAESYTDGETDPMIVCVDRVLKNYEGEVSNEDTVRYLIGYFDELFSALDHTKDPNEQEDYIDNCYNVIGTLCYYMDGDKNVPSARADIIERMNKLRLYVKSLPYTFFTSEMNRYVYMLYQRIKSFLSYEEKKEYLLEVVMFRQPITCIHSLMVESISETLCRYLLEKRPELFIGVADTTSIEEVVSKKYDILKFVSESALFHDVGKISMVDVINTQNRRLSDVEFKKIKTHPKNGLALLDKDKDFAEFFDVIVGHHRFFDGSAGYPEDFDNVSSKIRIVIDIVTIADCTDAATDILGRNYAKGKTFSDVLKEFEQGAGTRYNPDIVECIKNDEKLIGELTALTTENRLEIYKTVYSRYIR